jgi:hypothetical protein
MGDAAFERGHDREDFLEVAQAQFGDEAPLVRLQVHQPLGREHLERFAQGRAADAELLGQGGFVQALAGQQRMVVNPLAQQADRLFRQ